MQDIVIIGAGGVGRETAWIIEQINLRKPTWNIIGFIDDNEDIWNKNINGYKIIGGISCLDNIDENIKIIIAIANYSIKKNIVGMINSKFEFATIIHPDVYLNNTINIGEGTIIYPGVIMTTNIDIGNHVIISPKCGIGHDSKISDYVSLLWNVNISGFDIIGEGCLIGSGATIIQNKKIDNYSIIGAGSVIIKNVKEKCTVVGIPGEVIKNKKD
ncbi:MAG: NeuD/PglB/VioB family sugar acetyltransferase [Clostridium baratii]|uniref:NeuD/PglB/VioB family sugar acetyltransferase n=1 Tax=Clostridium baratii TaxID=1561 RepID=UPI00242BA651|nr:NeuD/PglB/VioB family sugar acetyltransferase [Clostridium baratii]MBS6041955.1 NeuD/PglB/VioB family sugar acetyltransferase [Clostridium baratii]